VVGVGKFKCVGVGEGEVGVVGVGKFKCVGVGEGEVGVVGVGKFKCGTVGARCDVGDQMAWVGCNATITKVCVCVGGCVGVCVVRVCVVRVCVYV
jgi:hypothetical protein